ncbi:hypothetical protein CANMA_003056 [Candida margitis]|uniref:uncharacterized protein n=1 Tax=Candida margitis TaxID=1775924 RepID=UPI002226D865|nr:uncharacterized protein CANMA_003056 [Candida margitis]KAI5967413.1 hypothetical protein CANMA_003056 [Candida margitis]
MATPKQLVFIDDVAKNHVKYYDPIFTSYLKLRQDLLKLYTSIAKQIEDAEEESATSQGSHMTRFKLHQLEVELSKVETTYKVHIDELLNLLRIEKTIKPDILTGIEEQLKQITTQNEELKEKITRIKTVEKPLLDRITKLVVSFNNNIDKSTAKLINSTVIKSLNGERSEEQKEAHSLQVDYRSLVFEKDGLRSQIRQILNDAAGEHGHIDEFLRNTRIFDELEESRVLYKLSRSTLHDISKSKTLDEYDEMIAKTVEQIQTLKNEGESTKQNWSKNAEKMLKIKAIVNEENDNDVEMTDD